MSASLIFQERHHHGQRSFRTRFTFDPQYRHHRAHRCRQDDDHRAGPLLHRRDPPDGGRRQGQHHDRLSRRGARAGDHDRRGGDHLPWKDADGRAAHDQHHRYAGARRFHGRGRALAAGAGWRGGGFLGRRGGRGAERDGLAAGGQVPGAADLLHQQDGPHRQPSSSASTARSKSGCSKATRSPCKSPSAPGPRGRWASSRA